MTLIKPERTDPERRAPGRVRCDGLMCASGKVVDISRTGAKLLVKGMFGPKEGETRTLQFRTAMGVSSPFPCMVMWTKRTGALSWEVGVHFTDITDAHRTQLGKIASVHGKNTYIQDAA